MWWKKAPEPNEHAARRARALSRLATAYEVAYTRNYKDQADHLARMFDLVHRLPDEAFGTPRVGGSYPGEVTVGDDSMPIPAARELLAYRYGLTEEEISDLISRALD